MAPKKKASPIAGRSIAAFFSSGPKPAQAGQVGLWAGLGVPGASPRRLGKPCAAAGSGTTPPPRPAPQDAAAATATPAAKLVKPADGSDVGAAKQAAAAAPQLPTVLAAKPAAKPAAAAPPAGPAAVGKNVSVYWADEDAWFTGVIKGG